MSLKRGKRFKGILFFAGAVLLFVLLAELMSECVIFIYNGMYKNRLMPYYKCSFYTSYGKRIGNQAGILKLMFHPQLVYANFPNQDNEYFHINSRGFRGPEIRKERYRVIVTGGSATFGTGLKSDSDTFEARLEKRLPETEVINAGVIGWQSSQELTHFILELSDLKPDLVIAFDGVNDYYFNTGLAKFSHVNKADCIQNELDKLNAFIYSNFFVRAAHIYALIFAKTLYLSERAAERISYNLGHVDSSSAQLEKMRITKSAGTYASNIVKMERFAKGSHIKFLCVLQPERDFMSEDIPSSYGYRFFCNSAKTIFNSHDILYIDLNGYGRLIKKYMFIDSMHLDQRGNQVIADILADEIDRRGLLN